MKRYGIHFRLLMAGILLISASTLTLGYIGVNITHEFMQERFENQIRFLAKYLALNAELGILIDERPMLKRLAENLLLEKDVIRVMIINDREECLADVAKGSEARCSTLEAPVILKENENLDNPFRQQFHRKESKETLIGKVRIDYSVEGIAELLTVMKVRFIWWSAILAVFSVLLFYFLSRSIVSPLTRLVGAAREVAAGNMKLRVTPGNLPETSELALSFNAMLDSLERSGRALADANREMVKQKTLAEMGKFSMIIAHEIKNPLGIIKSSVDLLKNDVDQGADNILVQYIEDEIRRLNRLIEEFLLFSKPAMPNFREVDLNAMLAEGISRFEIQLSGDEIGISSDIPGSPCYAGGDPDLLMRAIGNVLKNAVEANRRKGRISVRAACGDRAWVLEILDEGEGIRPPDLGRIFEPFFTTRAQGTGLGLAYAFQVIQNHHGTIRAKNRSTGRGAVFTIELPLEEGR
ncbi:PAS domain-containing sensor histidine kinase [Desulfococcus sp.]|uniref:sensor histidine kinase n=1 Tax=Desulfococcus sp. TaxID=2025834 RepID=UPI0035945CD9